MAFHNAFKYRGYTLDCEPVRRSDACFIAQVVISREAGEALDEYSFPNLCIRNSAPSAAQFAKDWGRQWVDARKSGQQ
jgi:hypothetical protein